MKRFLFFPIFLITFLSLSAQEFYSGDVVYLSGDDNLLTLRATGTHEKKKQAVEMALKSAFDMLFHTGIEGYRDGVALVTGENKYYMDRFFDQGRYMVFVKNYSENGDPQKMPNKHYKSTVTVNILANQLIADLIRNKMMEKPLDKMSMEATEAEIGLPSIMVVPYKKDGENYVGILQKDFDRRMAVNKVHSGFIERGVTTVDLEGKTYATKRGMEFESNTADSNDKQLITNSGADVYVIVDLEKDFAASGNRVSLSMTAYETASGRRLATSTGWTNRFRTTALDQLCVYAVKDQLTPFLNEISKSFARQITAGQSVVLKLSIGDGSSMTMNTPVAGKGAFANAVRQWVRKNCQNGRYHIQGIVDESMIFDNVQIPSKDTDGLPMDPAQFGYNLGDYITDELQTECEVKFDGSTIYVTVY